MTRRPPLIDPHAYARRVDYSQPPECVESQVAEIVAEAVLTAKGRVVQWRRCKNDNCGKLFPVGGWPSVPYLRVDAEYCSRSCYHTSRSARYRARRRANTTSP